MKVCEKIKRLRQEKGWSQEEIANKLNISTNAYGCIERGDTDVSLSRLEEISAVFEIDIVDFFDKKTGVFNLGGTQNNQQNWCNVYQSLDYLQIKTELEKQQLLNFERDKEVAYLKEIIELMKNRNANGTPK